MFLFLKKTWKIGLSILFGVAVLLFWGSVYPAHISYQEQFQLFLFDADYWWERIVVPGGLADYIAEYLTQFYYHVWAGACILAFLYVLLQRLVWKLAKEQGAADVYYPLSFLPIIVLWHFMGDENAMLSLVVALLLALSASCWYADLKGKWQRVAYILIVLPLLYWTAGAAHFIFMGWVIVREFRLNLKGKNFWGGIGWALVDDITHAEVKEEKIIDQRYYHTIKEVKNGEGPHPIKTPKGWLHLAHGVRGCATGLRYVLYMYMTSLEDPTKLIATPGGAFMVPEGEERIGDVSNVLFTNGWIADEDGTVFIYYASSDTRMHVATSTIDKLVDYCMNTPADGLSSSASVETLKKLIDKNLQIMK